jgi:cellulose synthase/poly-beta-1,6-N-acetylglucosamine synthase-like glycosyltransferase
MDILRNQILWNTVFNICSFTIWILLLINFVKAVAGAFYFRKTRKAAPAHALQEYPMVSILVPAHNEALVIRKTLESMLSFDYPHDRYEIIVINDNSTDDSARILAEVQREHSGRNLKILHADSTNGGKGKSNALNLAMEHISGSLIAIYDADNTPEPDALRILVDTLMADEKLGAVAGLIRTRNKNANLLTRCINIETLAAQGMYQAGRFQLFKLSLLPGTNFVIRKKIVEELGGWNTNALTEDTELSYRMYRENYYIRYMPLAVSWEQEPQTLGNYLKQRSRWARGNFHVFVKNISSLFDPKAGPLRLDIAWYILIHLIMLPVVACANIISVMCWLDLIPLTTAMATPWNWLISVIFFVLIYLIGMSNEKKEVCVSNVLVCWFMFFYSLLWYLTIFYSIFLGMKRRITGQSAMWDKTARYQEKEQEAEEHASV